MARKDIYNLEKWRGLAEHSGYRAEALAVSLGVSRRQLQRYTVTVFGRSPQDWLDQERLVVSAALLTRTRCVKLVAFKVGFKQISHFSREFKLFYGVSPTAYLVWNDQQEALKAAQRHTTVPPKKEASGRDVRLG